MKYRLITRFALLLVAILVMPGIGPGGAFAQRTGDPRPAPAILSAHAGGQIYNAGGSTPTVAHSLVEGGISEGTIEGGGNILLTLLLEDADGPDNILGSLDDDLRAGSGSPVVDAGSAEHLPPDVFDHDGDGDTTEPFPFDLVGAGRILGPGARPDLGAFENAEGTTPISSERAAADASVRFDIPYPNPLQDEGVMRFQIPFSEPTEIAVYDLLGRRQMLLFDGVAQAGHPYLLKFSVSSLASGLYIVHLHSASIRRSTNLVVAR